MALTRRPLWPHISKTSLAVERGMQVCSLCGLLLTMHTNCAYACAQIVHMPVVPILAAAHVRKLRRRNSGIGHHHGSSH